MILKNFFAKRARQSSEHRIYEAIVAQARQPWFYAELDVPDTVAGRYDMIVLHTALVLDRLSGEGPEARGFSQQLFDALFMDMDRSLREMGVGDLTVGKKVRKMAEMFYGRSDAYRQAIQIAGSDNGAALKQALSRNIYVGDADDLQLEALAGYVLRLQSSLANQHVEPIMTGTLEFPDVTNDQAANIASS